MAQQWLCLPFYQSGFSNTESKWTKIDLLQVQCLTVYKSGIIVISNKPGVLMMKWKHLLWKVISHSYGGPSGSKRIGWKLFSQLQTKIDDEVAYCNKKLISQYLNLFISRFEFHTYFFLYKNIEGVIWYQVFQYKWRNISHYNKHMYQMKPHLKRNILSTYLRGIISGKSIIKIGLKFKNIPRSILIKIDV